MNPKPLAKPLAPAATPGVGQVPELRGAREVATAASQPFRYPLERPFEEPDWKRIPGFREASRSDWESALWQRKHTLKNLKELKAALGPLLPEDLAASIERDQRERATMSILVTPQMVNTMDLEDLWSDPVRRYMLPAFADRRTDWPNHPRASRDSLHEAEMWVVEGLTHRYPTKVLAEVLSTCPQYCGHCTRMDLVGNDVPQVDKKRFVVPQQDALPANPRLPEANARRARRGGLRRRRRQPAHRDAGSLRLGADGHPQHPRHPPGHQRLHGHSPALPPGLGARRAGPAGEEGPATRRAACPSHPRQQRPPAHAARGAGRGCALGDGLPRRPQPGRAPARGECHGQGLARAVLHAPGPRARSSRTTSTCAT